MEASYRLLHALLHVRHGHPAVTFAMMLKGLLPNALLTCGGGPITAVVPKHLLAVREAALQFVM